MMFDHEPSLFSWSGAVETVHAIPLPPGNRQASPPYAHDRENWIDDSTDPMSGQVRGVPKVTACAYGLCGKPKQIVVAAMRKLLVLCFGVQRPASWKLQG
jgi:hypothetical protein